MNARTLPLAGLLLVFVLGSTASATPVTWESGMLSGTVGLGPVLFGQPATVSGTFTINPGSDDVAGLDESAASPGSFDLLVNPFTLVWSGTFGAPSAMPEISFGVNAGTFTTSVVGLNVMAGDTFDLTGPLASLTILPPLTPLPASLSAPSVMAHVTVTQVHFFGVTPVAFDFTGTYQAKAELSAPLPEPASLALASMGLLGLPFRGRRKGPS